jgi:hypothetical protein
MVPVMAKRNVTCSLAVAAGLFSRSVPGRYPRSVPTRCAIAVGLIALAACGSSSGRVGGSSSGAGGTCGPSAARTLAVDRVARVYQSGGGVYGCSTAGRRSYRLGAGARSIREGRAGPIALAGVDVAYGLTRYGVDTVGAQAVVRNLRNGGQLRSEPATAGRLGVEFFESIAAVVVKPGGAVAWIAQGGSVIPAGHGVIQVSKADARGRALLDSGSGIDVRSLRLLGSTLSWRHDGRVETARLY